MKRILVLLTVVSLLVPISANAQTTLDLQEKCAEGGKKFFFDSEKVPGFDSPSKELGHWYDEQGYGDIEYISHYNRKFDKCFILIRAKYYLGWESRSKQIPLKREERRTFSTQGLFNVFEGTEVGVYEVLIDEKPIDIKIIRCYVGAKTCKSMDEFEALIKPYMEE